MALKNPGLANNGGFFLETLFPVDHGFTNGWQFALEDISAAQAPGNHVMVGLTEPQAESLAETTSRDNCDKKFANDDAHLQVLSVSSEVYPLIKTGGLADVAGALPNELAKTGVRMRTFLPAYRKFRHILKNARQLHRYDNLMGVPAAIYEVEHEGLDLLILDAPLLFDREGGPYQDARGCAFEDNWLRFAAFSRAAADIGQGLLDSWQPDVVHLHDWQAALTAAYLHYDVKPGAPCITTIHNIAFQGQFDAAFFRSLGLPDRAFYMDGVEYFGDVSFLKAGLQLSDAITTVSPTYAHEISSAEFGMGLQGVINAREDHVHGVVNGIDTDLWDPETDPHIPMNFSRRKLAARRYNRREMEHQFGLKPSSRMIVSVVSRLTWQKGLDVLADCVDQIVAMGANLVVLGQGMFDIEQSLLSAAQRHPGRVGVNTNFTEERAHLVHAGADATILPSRFEPCGLTQQYALRYGCAPVVNRTGGLADTVVDANDAAIASGAGTGFVFNGVTQSNILHAIRRAQTVYADRVMWTALIRNAMKSDCSWERSAERYAKLYSQLSEAAAEQNLAAAG